MTIGEWVGLATSVLFAVLGIWKHLRAKDYAGALDAAVTGIESLKREHPATFERVTNRIQATALDEGTSGALHSFLVEKGYSKADAEAPAAPPSVPGAMVVLLAVSGLLAGCASQQIQPYKLAVRGMAETGDAVRPLLKSPMTGGEQALVDAWDFQRAAAHKLVEAGK